MGKVYIVGAGPGPADLLTMRTVSVLRAAQVVLHDDLVSAEVLALCPESAQMINVGKRCGKHGSSQQEINALMVRHARRGRAVVRLKSGDPAVFGRMGEELDALRKAGITFEIVPGVTAAIAAATAASVTLTDRRVASALVVLTAHTSSEEPLRRPMLDLERTTFAVYMPGPNYGKTARELMAMGIAASMPCAVVSNACRDNEEVRFMVLADLESATGIAAPAVLIVGRVASGGNFSESTLLLEKRHDAVGIRAENPAYQ
jgi:uroporphyrin-III C-methyltransferase